jgi:hypothetical protein
VSAAPILQSDEDAADFAQRFAEKWIERGQAEAHSEINRVFGRMRDSLSAPRREKTPAAVDAATGDQTGTTHGTRVPSRT